MHFEHTDLPLKNAQRHRQYYEFSFFPVLDTEPGNIWVLFAIPDHHTLPNSPALPNGRPFRLYVA